MLYAKTAVFVAEIDWVSEKIDAEAFTRYVSCSRPTYKHPYIWEHKLLNKKYATTCFYPEYYKAPNMVKVATGIYKGTKGAFYYESSIASPPYKSSQQRPEINKQNLTEQEQRLNDFISSGHIRFAELISTLDESFVNNDGTYTLPIDVDCTDDSLLLWSETNQNLVRVHRW